MRICLVGPGIMPIPPTGWGAVEILIWDIKTKLEELGHQVLIVNTRNRQEIVDLCNSFNPDFVHVQYDEYWDICEHLRCNNVAITSHFGYLDQVNRWDGYYHFIMSGFLTLRRTKIFALSTSIASQYMTRGFENSRVKVVPNGVRDDLFIYKKDCFYPNRSIFLAKIDNRKRQSFFQSIPNLFFAGNCVDSSFDTGRNNYLGEWTKDILYSELTNYANLVLLSDGEAHPLVCLEAMCVGLGLVISEYATANLDLNLPFIDVVPESRIRDIDYVTEVIEKNRKKSVLMRDEIKRYCIDNFSWDVIIKKYLSCV